MAGPLNRLDWSLVQAFLAVAEEGSLSAAARRLGASQPTLSRQVKAMEAALGADLFVRQARGLALSEAGAALLDAARTMGEAAARLHLVAEGRKERIEGTVRITASEAMAFWHLPPIVARLRQEEPRIAVEVVASDESRNLLFREADIAVRMYRPTQLDIVARHLGEVEIGLYAARSYLERSPPVDDLAALMAHDWVGYDTSPLIVEGMRAAGLNVDRTFFRTRCDGDATYWALVRAGCGLGFGQVRVAEDCPDIVRVPLPVDIPTLPLWLAVPEAIRRVPRIARSWDMLAEGLAPLVT